MRLSRMHLVIFSLMITTLPLTSSAKVFRNAYISFELPQKWQCKIEGTEWVCSSTFRQQSREAVIILTAKEVGPTDNISAYEAHLKQPRLITSKAGKPTRSIHALSSSWLSQPGRRKRDSQTQRDAGDSTRGPRRDRAH